jgi:pseudaminic acid synthase
MSGQITINNRAIGEGRPVYIVAEMSANHGQNFDRAAEILMAAKRAGADAIKLQTYTPDTLTIDCSNEYFQIQQGTIWQGRSLYDLYGEAYTPWEWQPKLRDIALDLGLDFFSTPFDETAVDFLQEMGVPAFKIASFEIVDLPLIHKIGATGKPVILSTGMATIGEIDEAVRAIRSSGNNQMALLKCVSSYPAPPEDMNLRTIAHMSDSFDVPVGLSDHSMGIAVPVSAVSLGACIIEKHFTLSRSLKGPDSSFSLEPDEFQSMVDAVRIAEKAVGAVCYHCTEKEAASRLFRRSLFVVKNMKPGDIFDEKNVRSIRPGYGLPPKEIVRVMGHRAARNIERGTPLHWNLVA